MKLIVGLGNPGKEYKNTRHNVGFMVLDNFLGDVSWKKKWESEYYIDNNDIIYLKPTTNMNLSGQAVKKVIDFYKIDIKDVLVIQDDLDLKKGVYKIKRNSSSGGHNGIRSIIKELNSDEFGRLKVGIDKSELIPADKYVLSKFGEEEMSLLKSNYDTFNDIIQCFINNGIEKAMETYNKN